MSSTCTCLPSSSAEHPWRDRSLLLSARCTPAQYLQARAGKVYSSTAHGIPTKEELPAVSPAGLLRFQNSIASSLLEESGI